MGYLSVFHCSVSSLFVCLCCIGMLLGNCVMYLYGWIIDERGVIWVCLN